MSTWASRIKDLRSTGLTLAAIGERIGLSPSAVSDIEQLRTAEPKGEAAVRLDALHRSVCGETFVPPTVASRKTA